MTEKRENYRGFAIVWQSPAQTGPGCQINVAPDNADLLDLMNKAMGAKGSKIIAAPTEEDALKQARAFIDGLFR